jgi:hypothetical protein
MRKACRITAQAPARGAKDEIVKGAIIKDAIID